MLKLWCVVRREAILGHVDRLVRLVAELLEISLLATFPTRHQYSLSVRDTDHDVIDLADLTVLTSGGGHVMESKFATAVLVLVREGVRHDLRLVIRPSLQSAKSYRLCGR